MRNYPGISSEAFRHPLDKEAEEALRSLPGFDSIARKFVEFMYERPQFVYQMGNSIQVGPRQYGNLYQIFRECVQALDVYPEPSFFVTQQPLSNAYAIGEERPSIILNSGLLDIMEEEEIRSVIAHELGHIKCGHTTLTQIAIWALTAATFIGQATLGLSNLLISSGLVMAFYEWKRKSELSADRAALLAIDDLNPVMGGMMKLAGGSFKHGHECNLEEFIRQSERYQELDQNSLNQVYKFLLYNNLAQGVFLSHPFLVERVAILREWSNSSEYQQIRQGNYQKATKAGSVEVPSEASESELDTLKQEIEELQREISRIKSQRQEATKDDEQS